MTIPVRVSNGNTDLSMSSIGEVHTAPYKYSETQFVELAEPDTGYNLYVPKVGCEFVITAIFAVADKQVSASVSADLIIYEATSTTDTVVAKVLVQTAIVQDQIQFFSPTNILVAEGAFLNAKTTDDDVHVTITGYYIPSTR